MVSTPLMSSSMKRTQMLNRTQNVTCLVDGCTSDLSKCREYHRRHRVCERHSKTPVVFIRGEEQRFCQQCSRFHSLGEFDEAKRSCRKRLDGHNRRRRKTQPESFYMTSQRFSFNCQGTNFLQFNSPHIDATAPWPMVARSEDEATLHNRIRQLQMVEGQSPPSSSSSCINNGGGDDRFLKTNDLKMSKYATEEVFVSQPLLHAVVSDYALSLLSTHRTQTSGFDSNRLLQPNVTLLPVRRLGLGLHFNGLDQYSCSPSTEGGEPAGGFRS